MNKRMLILVLAISAVIVVAVALIRFVTAPSVEPESSSLVKPAQIQRTQNSGAIKSFDTSQKALPSKADNLKLNEQISQFDPNRDYSYTDTDHEQLMTRLETMRERFRSGKRFTSSEVEVLWPQFDAVVRKNFMHPVEALQIKTWLVNQLDAPNSVLSQRLAQETKATADKLATDINAAQKAHDTDPKYVAYKAEEARLTEYMLKKYPDDTQKASQELEKALNKVRVEIYSQ